MLRHLMERPDLPVSEVARSLKVPCTVASQYLRALNARGLLKARRVGRWVYYRAGPDESIREAKLLLEALRRTFATETDPVDVVFRLATAFTHPRRQDILRALQGRGLTIGQLKARTGISLSALRRHLGKLVDRGFVDVENGVYRRAVPNGSLATTLSQLALASRR